jgi:hypothetical protein
MLSIRIEISIIGVVLMIADWSVTRPDVGWTSGIGECNLRGLAVPDIRHLSMRLAPAQRCCAAAPLQPPSYKAAQLQLLFASLH